MVHPHNSVRTDGTVLFHGVDNSDNGGDQHLTHLSQAVDCHLTERSKQNKCVDGNKDDGVNDSVDDSDDDGDKQFTHLTKADDCCLMERSKQNKCVDDDNGD
eukprot:6213103-Ditylum_brightwellii.AAC.1